MKNLLLAIFLTLTPLRAILQDYIITANGVGDDRTQLSTQAIQQVIDKANENGGGILESIPGPP